MSQREQNVAKTIETKTLKQNRKKNGSLKGAPFFVSRVSVCLCVSFSTRCYFFFCCCCCVYFVIALLIHFDKNKIVADHCWLCVDLVSDFIDFQCVQYSSCNWPFIREKSTTFMVHCHSNTHARTHKSTFKHANTHTRTLAGI